MHKQYHPTPEDRCKAACAFDNKNRASFDPVFTPEAYEANGATVTLKDGGAVYWVVTLDEAKEIGISHDPFDLVTVNRRKWVVTLA